MVRISPVRQTSLGEHIAHELRVLVISGQLSPGTHLVEDTLAGQFEVSRGPVRDALRELENEGLLESRRRGLYVKGLSDEDVDELYSLRETLESFALRLAMEKAESGSTVWDRFEAPLAEMRGAADRADAHAFACADLEFHAQFLRLAGHRRLTSVWEQYRPTFAVMLDITNAQDRDLHPSAEAHAELLATARSGDLAVAATTLTEHLLGARNRLRSALREARRAASS